MQGVGGCGDRLGGVRNAYMIQKGEEGEEVVVDVEERE